jgi:ketosteroid isomerase-like protein
MPSRAEIEAWIEGYERAWRTAGTEALTELFTADAAYRMSPYDEPARGLDEIATLWERERDGPDERFTISHEVLAAEGDTAVIRVEVEYERGGERAEHEYRDLWVIRFDSEGRCREFEEWAYWPELAIPDTDRR